ncbi:MAG: Wzz/FepE/Etk N-terminal domain-containing protein, partial [Thermodesulfovibrionales bacterium]
MEEKEIHLRDYIRVLIKRRYNVLTFFIIVFVISIIVTFSSVPLYMAGAKLLIEKSESGNIASSRFFMPYDPEFYETQFQLIKSSAVARKVVKRLSLDTNYDKYAE